MENLSDKLKELQEKEKELRKSIEELDNSILMNPHMPESIKEYIRIKREEEKKPEPFDGLIISNKIIGYDPDTFNPIYESNP
jgi:hypothetical protein